MFTVTKSYRDFAAAHRQPNHQGHCRLIHGHNWGFDITFAADRRDDNGFVIDVGRLKPIKAMLDDLLDHTLLLNELDPFKVPDGFPAEIRRVPNCGMEGLAELVFHWINRQFVAGDLGEDAMLRNVRVIEVTCLEDSKNSATYRA